MVAEQKSAETRRAQLTGGSTFIVSLPKDWTNEVGLRKGDLLKISQQPDGSLSVVPQNLATVSGAEGAATFFEITPGDDPESAVREFVARYLAGYNMIRVRFGRQAARYKNHIKEAIRRKLIGVEIVEEFGDEMTAQCLLYTTELPVKKALARMSIIASSMQKETMAALKAMDRASASEIIQRDDEIDRFYFYIVRQLKMAVNNRGLLEEMELKRPTDCLGYRLVVKNIERVADHAVRIAGVVSEMDEPVPPKIYAKIAALSKMANELYEGSMDALEKLDTAIAHRIIERTGAAQELEDEIMEDVLGAHKGAKSVMEIEVVAHALKRIAEYGSDIAEMAINLSIENRMTAKK